MLYSIFQLSVFSCQLSETARRTANLCACGVDSCFVAELTSQSSTQRARRLVRHKRKRTRRSESLQYGVFCAFAPTPQAHKSAVGRNRKDVQVHGCKAMWDSELRRTSDFGYLRIMDSAKRQDGHKVKQRNSIGHWPCSPCTPIRVAGRPWEVAGRPQKSRRVAPRSGSAASGGVRHLGHVREDRHARRTGQPATRVKTPVRSSDLRHSTTRGKYRKSARQRWYFYGKERTAGWQRQICGDGSPRRDVVGPGQTIGNVQER